MNLFYLDENLDKCAEAHIDKHVTKMQLETAQMLSTNIWIDEVLGYIPRKITSDETAKLRTAAVDANLPTSVRYKPCFFNHPCTIWMRESYENYEYSVLLVDALNTEAMWRGFNRHKSSIMVENLPMPTRMEHHGLTTPALAMPDERKQEDPVASYRDYYLNEKAGIATYTRREPPDWWWKNPNSAKNYREAIEVYKKALLSEALDAPEVARIFKKQAEQIMLEGRNV